MAISVKRIIRFSVCMHTDHNLPSDSIMTVDALDTNLDIYFTRVRGYLSNVPYKQKEQKDRFGGIDEKIMHWEYTLDLSQYKVFLVI